jgi:hypothetical protein
MTSVRPRGRELAERSSNGTQVRLLWWEGTGHLWVEVRERDDRLLWFAVQPEQALDAFHHPYAYAGSDRPLIPAPPLAPRGRSRAADRE